jgi:hypothetical protein
MAVSEAKGDGARSYLESAIGPNHQNTVCVESMVVVVGVGGNTRTLLRAMA